MNVRDYLNVSNAMRLRLAQDAVNNLVECDDLSLKEIQQVSAPLARLVDKHFNLIQVDVEEDVDGQTKEITS